MNLEEMAREMLKNKEHEDAVKEMVKRMVSEMDKDITDIYETDFYVDGVPMSEMVRNIEGEKIMKVDVENLSYVNENVHQMADVMNELLVLYSRKNWDYGNTFDQSLDEDGLLVSKIRLGDKFGRFSQLLKQDAMVKDESIEDTLMDLANYSLMTVKWMRSNKDGTNE